MICKMSTVKLIPSTAHPIFHIEYVLHIYRAILHPCTLNSKEVYDCVHIYWAAVNLCIVHSKKIYDCVHTTYI